MKHLLLSAAFICISGLLSACGGSDNDSSDTSPAKTDKLTLPYSGDNAYVQSFNLGHLWSSSFSAVDGFQVTIDGLTQTLHLSSGNNSWHVTWNGEYEGEQFNNWTAFGYEDTPADNEITGRFRFYHYNSHVFSSELSYYRDGRIHLTVQDDNGSPESAALLVPLNSNGIRIINRDASDTSATVVDLIDAEGSQGIGYEGCTADLFTLATNVSSCSSSVAF
ncbi:MAG: hypothetical protein LRY66_15410 [Saccharospirillaceae bacterium]|nr:hypothetical protein [Saccharospirillaceae bacterium]MCD8532693.1 hypothetical protein [Saccharospirillaceae bacterium]